jgi:gliding-associated putative ABC transporter substrate-binding component GldG
MASRFAIHATRWGLLGATLAIVVLVNLLAGNWFFRLDLTADKEFTLADGTRDLLAQLDDDLIVRGYFTASLPPPYNRAKQVVKETLDEYRDLSHGHLRYEFIDPQSLGEAYEQQMAQVGVPMVQVTDVDSDKMAVVNGFMGLVLLYEDKQEILPVVQGAQGLEFMLTAKIRKLTGTGRPKIGVMQGFGAPDLFEDMGQILPILGEQYEVQPFNLEEGEAVPAGLDSVLVVSPQQPLSQEALLALEGYLTAGGGLALLGGGVKAELGAGYAEDLPPLFGDLPAAWGVKIGRDLVADRRNVRITVSQRQGIFTMQNMVDYPYIPSLTALSDANPVVAGLESIFLPFSATVRTSPVDGLHHTTLAETSVLSWRMVAPYDVGPLVPFDPRGMAPSARGPHPVAVAVTGVFPPVYAASEIDDDSAPASGRLLVVGSGELLLDAYLMGGENIPFLLNAIDWLSGDEGLIGLRSRGVTDRPLVPIGDDARQAIKVVNLFGGAVLLIAIGLLRWKFRQARRRRLQEDMG